MENFTFKNPTEIIFGKGQIQCMKSRIPKHSNILLVYGGGSIKNITPERSMNILLNAFER